MGKYKHIELFAGCGGMSLGLEKAGFELVFANELSPMASETFAFNILDENLEKLANEGKCARKVLWVNSNFPNSQLTPRLRENPFNYPVDKFSDIKDAKRFRDFSGKLLVGNINHLLTFLAKNKKLVEEIKNQDIDLLSGGPPCQGFSLAGKREKNDNKNLLPLSFAQFAGLVKPKIVLLENVKGITAPFIEDGKKYYAWLEVSKAFALEGYMPICIMLNSKYFGVPQNRPRFILIGIREDLLGIFKKYTKRHKKFAERLEDSLRFLDEVKSAKSSTSGLDNIKRNSSFIYNIETPKDIELFDGDLFPQMFPQDVKFKNAEEAIDDLREVSSDNFPLGTNGYAQYLNKLFFRQNLGKDQKLQNHIFRKHNFQVKARFRLFQVLNEMNGLRNEALSFILTHKKGKNIKRVFEEITKHKLWIKIAEKEVLQKLNNSNELIDYIKQFKSKKHSQRALKRDQPAPAQLTIPDDICHYDKEQLRTLTVREMARFQSFPDWFVFRSKITTGGQNRSFEVPQYTQVGNAVPPLLAYALGTSIKEFLKHLKNGKG